MVKLLAIDIDATITNSDGSISKQVIESIRQSHYKVSHITLVSARPPQGVETVAHLLDKAVYRVCYLGAVIIEPNRKEIERIHLDIDTAREIARYADLQGVSLTLSINDTEYHTQNQSRPSMTPRISVASAVSVLDSGIPPVLIGVTGHLQSSLIYEYCLKHFPQSMHVVRQYDSDGTLASTLIVNARATKGHAVIKICKLLSISPNEVLAIGDSESDVPMFQIAGLSVAVGNADSTTRSHAKFIAPLSFGDGVVWALEKLL